MLNKFGFHPFKGKITTARQLIRNRNIILGLPILHIHTALIPYGYEMDPDNKTWLRPVQKELEALYYARVSWRKAPLSNIAVWLSKEINRQVSEDTLYYLFKTRTPTSAYLLPLHDRILIATCLTEEEAILKAPQGIEVRSLADSESRQKYINARTKAVQRKEEERAARGSGRIFPYNLSNNGTDSQTPS